VTFRSTNFYTFFEGHFSGGRIVRLDAQRLLFSVGDFGWDGTGRTPQTARDPATDLGKILAIEPSTGRSAPFAIGLRNGQGLTIDRSGRIWETEHGPKGGDELNLIRKGGDFGWPVSTLGVQYGGRPWPLNGEQGRHASGIPPVFAWVPSVGVSNLIEAPRQQFPRWRGDLLVATLVDNGLWRLRIEGGRVQYVERISFDGERLRDLIALPDGRITILTDTHKIILVRRALNERTLSETDNADPTQGAALPPARTNAGERGRIAFQAACATCHRLDGEASVGPNLGDVVGRRVGGLEFPYSAALASKAGVWDRARLKAFLADPKAVYPGTLMSKTQLKPGEIEAVLAYLEEARHEAKPVP
jgi:cytochrome c2